MKLEHPKFSWDSADKNYSVKLQKFLNTYSQLNTYHETMTRLGRSAPIQGLPRFEQQWVTPEVRPDCPEPRFTFLASPDPGETGQWQERGAEKGTGKAVHYRSIGQFPFLPGCIAYGSTRKAQANPIYSRVF